MENWEELKEVLQNGLKHCYPITKQTTHSTTTDNLDKRSANNKWGTKDKKPK